VVFEDLSRFSQNLTSTLHQVILFGALSLLHANIVVLRRRSIHGILWKEPAGPFRPFSTRARDLA
jgi:hypothetical protein